MRRLLLRSFLLAVAILSFAARGGAQSQTAPTSKSKQSKVHLGAYPSQEQIPVSAAMPSAVGSGVTDSPVESEEPDTPEAAERRKHGDFVFAPIPVSNQAIHFGFVPVVEYVFHINPNDSVSPPSSLVLAGTIATRGTWALGGGGRLFLKQDRYRVTAFGGHGKVGYDVFGVGSASGDAGRSIPIEQHGNMVLGEVLFRLAHHLYLGPRFNYRNVSTASGTSPADLPAGLDPNDLGVTYSENGGGFKMLHDSRNDVFYPTNGHTLQVQGDFFHAKREATTLLPEKPLNYQNYQPSYNHYLSLTSRQMLAFRGMICDIEGSPPFFELCQFGSMSDIRGYQTGRYRDRRMFAAQAEYRSILSKRWGYTVFGGVGEVAHTWGEFTAGGLLPAGGAGIRFNLDKKSRINLRADVAYGRNGWAWNFSLGEAF